MTPLQGHDIIILTMSRWDGVYSSAIYSLAQELAKHNRVFYIDHPFTLKDFWQQRHTTTIKNRKKALLYGKEYYRQVPNLPKNFVAVTPRLMLPINWLSSGKVYQTLSKLNDKLLFSCIRKLIKDFSIKEYIFFNSFDPFYVHDFNFPKAIQPDLTIYQSRDDISQEAYIARHGIKLEQTAIAKSTVSLATSQELTTILSTPQKQVQYLPNAANVALFSQALSKVFPRPKDLPENGSKVITYIGNISQLRIDFELLRKIAKSNSAKSLILIGIKKQEDEVLDNLPNVKFLGPKPLTSLPAYLQYTDCAIIPFQCNTLTKSIYPLKINEYLAAGKPVVTTNFSKDIALFKDIAHVVNTHEAFLAAIDQSLVENSITEQKKRLAVAQQNSWPARVQQFWEIITNNTNK